MSFVKDFFGLPGDAEADGDIWLYEDGAAVVEYSDADWNEWLENM